MSVVEDDDTKIKVSIHDSIIENKIVHTIFSRIIYGI